MAAARREAWSLSRRPGLVRARRRCAPIASSWLNSASMRLRQARRASLSAQSLGAYWPGGSAQGTHPPRPGWLPRCTLYRRRRSTRQAGRGSARGSGSGRAARRGAGRRRPGRRPWCRSDAAASRRTSPAWRRSSRRSPCPAPCVSGGRGADRDGHAVEQECLPAGEQFDQRLRREAQPVGQQDHTYRGR